METLSSKLQETSRHVTEHSDALVTRTRDASESFFTETRGAGREFFGFVNGEANRWRRFISRRAETLSATVLDVTRLTVLEKSLLVRVDDALRTLDERIRQRLVVLGRKTPRKQTARAPKRSKAKVATSASGAVRTRRKTTKKARALA